MEIRLNKHFVKWKFNEKKKFLLKIYIEIRNSVK